jgi:hypothetical protein
MVHTWGCAVLTIVLDLVALCPANAQPTKSLSNFEAAGRLKLANSTTLQAGNPRFDPNADRTARTGRSPNAPVSGGNGLIIVIYVAAVELALAAIVAASCWLVLAIAGICDRFENRRRSPIVWPFLRQQPAVQTVGNTSRIKSKAAG